MMLLCEHRNSEGRLSFSYIHRCHHIYVCTVTPCGVLNAQGALLKSERWVTEYIFEVSLFLLLEEIPTQNQWSMKENKQQHRDNRSYNQNSRICNNG